MRVLIIVAHPDDETLGMGGTIRKHVLSGHEVYVKCLTDGVGARETTSEQQARARWQAATAASGILGFKWLKPEELADNELDKYTNLQLTKVVEGARAEVEPHLVYTHSGTDLNIDHRLTFAAVLTAFRPDSKCACNEIRCFEVPSATDYSVPSAWGLYSPNLFINVDTTWEDKILALHQYQSELRESPNSRSLDGITRLAEFRGHQAGIRFAESFEVVRKIEK
ncbi:PIG-L family deacetylase [Luminiphilus sp.]|nr:PIG-L family deacetylase [Luminiphilus sp.]